MNFSTIVRSALRRWYITTPGVLLSLLIATTIFSSMPPKYTSSGIAVLARQNNPTMTNFVNPILGTDGSLSTVTLTLVQALDTPEVKAQLGLRAGADDFKISNVGQATTAVTVDHPFIYITTQSTDAQKSAEIVGGCNRRRPAKVGRASERFSRKAPKSDHTGEHSRCHAA